MTITVVGTAHAEDDLAVPGNLTLTLPAGLQQNDVVLIVAGRTDGRTLATSSSGWTETLYNTLGSSGLNVGYWRKRMGASPDSTFVLTADAGGTLGRGCVCIALRGCDTTTMEDAAHTTAGATADAAPDGAAITTVTNGAYVWNVGIKNSGVGASADSTVTAPSSYTNKVTSPATAVTLSLTVAGAGKIVSSAGSEDPGAWSTWDTGFNWASVTAAARPVVTAGGTAANLLFLGMG